MRRIFVIETSNILKICFPAGKITRFFKCVIELILLFGTKYVVYYSSFFVTLFFYKEINNSIISNQKCLEVPFFEVKKNSIRLVGDSTLNLELKNLNL